MRLQFFRLFLCLSFLPFCYVQGQVTVWPNNPSVNPAILQIDGQQSGLRLSRLSESERNALSVNGNEKAKGLVIYNTSNQMIEFWDGTAWRPLGGNSQFINGLSQTSTHAQLGGSLIENTEIGMEGNDFSIQTRKGAMSVNNNNLYVDSLNIRFNNLTDFSVNDVLMVENGKEVKLNTGSSGFYVNMPDTTGLLSKDTIYPVLSVINNDVKVAGNLQYRDGNEGAFPINSTHILFSDAQGNASWEVLNPSTITKQFSITWPTGTSTGPAGTRFPTNTWSDITSEVSLEPGKWLIIGRFTSYTRDATTSSNYLSMLRLIKKNVTTSTDEELYISGILPERKASTGNENNGSYAMPQIITFVDVTTTENYRVQFMTEKSNTWYSTMGWVGDSYFRAVRIND